MLKPYDNITIAELKKIARELQLKPLWISGNKKANYHRIKVIVDNNEKEEEKQLKELDVCRIMNIVNEFDPFTLEKINPKNSIVIEHYDKKYGIEIKNIITMIIHKHDILPFTRPEMISKYIQKWNASVDDIHNAYQSLIACTPFEYEKKNSFLISPFFEIPLLNRDIAQCIQYWINQGTVIKTSKKYTLDTLLDKLTTLGHYVQYEWFDLNKKKWLQLMLEFEDIIHYRLGIPFKTILEHFISPEPLYGITIHDIKKQYDNVRCVEYFIYKLNYILECAKNFNDKYTVSLWIIRALIEIKPELISNFPIFS